SISGELPFDDRVLRLERDLIERRGGRVHLIVVPPRRKGQELVEVVAVPRAAHEPHIADRRLGGERPRARYFVAGRRLPLIVEADEQLRVRRDHFLAGAAWFLFLPDPD